MGEYMPAEIHIGGRVRQADAQELCQALSKSRASLEWDGSPCQISTVEELLSARSTEPGGPAVLKLCDSNARWGEFEGLEKFLQAHDIAYCRWSDGKYEYDPEAVAYRPETGSSYWLTNHDRHPIVFASPLAQIEAGLAGLLIMLKEGPTDRAEVLRQVEQARDALRAELPPDLPPLEALEVVGDDPAPQGDISGPTAHWSQTRSEGGR